MKFNKIKHYIKSQLSKEPVMMKRTVKNTAKQCLILFFIAMFGFTFLSRAADSVMTAKVNVKKPVSQGLNFQVSGAGTLKEKDVSVIKLLQGLMIEQTFAQPGETVEEGDSLFAYNMEDLQSLYDEKNAALEKNKIEQKKLSLNDSESDLESAKLDQKYAEQSVQDANDNLDAAKESINKEVEEAYHNAKSDYENSKTEQENAVEEAKQKLADAKAALKELEEKQNSASNTADTDNTDDTGNMDDTGAPESNTKEDGDKAVTQEELDNAKDAVEEAKDNLKSVKSTWKETVSEAKSTRDETKERLDEVNEGSYDYTSGLSDVNSALSEAQHSLEKANLSVEEATKNENRQNQTTSLSKDSYQLDIDIAQQEVDELKNLIDQDGIVTAPGAGAVVSMGVESGVTVSGAEVVSVAVNGVCAQLKVEKEDAKRLSLGDAIKIKVGDSKEETECKLESIGTKEEDGMLDCIVTMPEDNDMIGSNVTYEWSKETKQYDFCIPITALREDGYRQTYVLMTQSTDTILGNELITSRVNVSVLEKDADTAAVEGSLSYNDQIIVSSNKEISEGDRIRVESNE